MDGHRPGRPGETRGKEVRGGRGGRGDSEQGGPGRPEAGIDWGGQGVIQEVGKVLRRRERDCGAPKRDLGG